MTANDSRSIFVPDKLALTVSLTLFSLAAISWIASYYLMPFMMMASSSGGMASEVAGIASSFSIASVSLFEVVWIIGMAAMMFPAMTPTVLFYDRIATKQEPNPSLARLIGTPLFLGGYLITYAVLGLAAFFVVYEAVSISMNLPGLGVLAIIVPSALLIATGLYQFTSLKTRCLSNCVSPIGFFAIHYSKGFLGSLRMGLRSGIYCVGCCWAFMLVMLGVGAMSIPVMAVLAGVIALEKVIVRGARWFNGVVAAGFITLGVLVLVFPSILSLI